MNGFSFPYKRFMEFNIIVQMGVNAQIANIVN